MKPLLFAVLLLPGLAFAQPPCWPRDVGGTGSSVAVRTGIAGLAYAWRCPNQPRVFFVAGPWSAFVPTWESEARRLVTATDAEKQAAWAKYVTRTAPLSAGVVALRDAATKDAATR